MNGFIINLCWKNIWRNRRRTFLTVGAISVGVMWMVFAYNYYDALHEQLINNAISYHSGHLAITKPEYYEREDPSYLIEDSRAIEQWLMKNPAVKAYSTRVHLQGLISSPRGVANIRYTGIDPEKESRTTRFASNIVQGAFFNGELQNPIVIGTELAKKLKVRVGSKVVALTQGIDGSIGNELFRIAGIFKTDSNLDKSVAFISLGAARFLLSLPELAVHQVSIILHRDRDLNLVHQKFREEFKWQPLQIQSWMDIQKHLMGIIQLQKAANRILMVIVLIIASLGIANSILMGLLERTREFGVMMAMGTAKSDMVRMVVTETFLLSLVGVLMGNVCGNLLTLYFNKVGFDLKWLTDQTIVINGSIIDTITYPIIQWHNNWSITVVILVLALVSAIIPLHHVSKLNEVKALNTH